MNQHPLHDFRLPTTTTSASPGASAEYNAWAAAVRAAFRTPSPATHAAAQAALHAMNTLHGRPIGGERDY
ncbi:MAG: hypothetical protein H0W42_11555 [Gemmatimonadaceae bacterium]|nr:hypothetical protein [Gemmatimonadaceae bacterium]